MPYWDFFSERSVFVRKLAGGWLKNFFDTFSRFDRVPARDRQGTDGQTSLSVQ